MLSILDDTGSVERIDVEFVVCNSFYLRLKGALGKGRIDTDEAYLLPGVSRIHTFFMSEPIAVIGFNSEGKIVRYRESIPPYRIFPWRTNSISGILELAPNRLADLDPGTGDYFVRFDKDSASAAGLSHLSSR